MLLDVGVDLTAIGIDTRHAYLWRARCIAFSCDRTHLLSLSFYLSFVVTHLELAYFGSKVIHPKTMQPAIQEDPQIPIYIRNTFEPNLPGTRIYLPDSSSTSSVTDKVVCGFSTVENMALVNVEGCVPLYRSWSCSHRRE
jgi:hypothetical protein